MSRATVQELTMFAQLNANHPKLLEWLNAEKLEAVKFMTSARDPVFIHRFQGEVTRLEKIIDLLTSANKILKP